MAENNRPSIQVGNKIYSWIDSYEDPDTGDWIEQHWEDVTAEYPYLPSSATAATVSTSYYEQGLKYLLTGTALPSIDGLSLVYTIEGTVDPIQKNDNCRVCPVLWNDGLYSYYYYGIGLYETQTDQWDDPDYKLLLAQNLETAEHWYLHYDWDGHDEWIDLKDCGMTITPIENLTIQGVLQADTATDEPPVVAQSEWSRYRNGQLRPYKPVHEVTDGGYAKYNSDDDSFSTTTEFNGTGVNVTDFMIAPHIYVGPELSQTQLTELLDDSLVIYTED